MKKYILLLAITIIPFGAINSQVFTDMFDNYEKIIEYEGQKFLMREILNISSKDFDMLRIDKTIKESDKSEGFMFILTSYTFNGKSGVVISSFNATNFAQTNYSFVNVHLTDEEFTSLHNQFKELDDKLPTRNIHGLKIFDERLTIDVCRKTEMEYTLWVDNYSRHTFTKMKWDKAYKRYTKFKG